MSFGHLRTCLYPESSCDSGLHSDNSIPTVDFILMMVNHIVHFINHFIMGYVTPRATPVTTDMHIRLLKKMVPITGRAHSLKFFVHQGSIQKFCQGGANFG